MGYYIGKCRNEQSGNVKRISTGRNSHGVCASVELDTNTIDTVGIELWLRPFHGEPRLQVSEIGNGYNVSRSGKMLFEGTIDEFVELLEERVR